MKAIVATKYGAPDVLELKLELSNLNLGIVKKEKKR